MRQAGPFSGGMQIFAYASMAVAVWLGWEIVKVPVIDRAGPAIAVRLSPTSPEVLRAAAEDELAAKRYENARFLSQESLARAPFNSRAVRVRGLVEAQGDDQTRANDLLTLAGNWSLRDDPAHAWLMEDRLKKGDYGSSFAHADTLVRRRADLYPQVFNLFTTAALTDPRSVPHLVRLLAAFPPWRDDYINSVHARDDAAPVVAALALGLQRTPRPFTDSELGHLYRTWASKGMFSGIRYLRTELRRPNPTQALQNGDFGEDASPDTIPFQWRMGAAPGVIVQITEYDLGRTGGALRVQYDGRKSGVLADQLMVLNAGSFVLSGQRRIETPVPEARMRWLVICADTGAVIAEAPFVGAPAADQVWRRWTVAATVPATRCTAQWLRLEAIPGGSSVPIVVWFDDIRVD